MIVLVAVGYALLAIYELIPLYKQKQKKDFWVDAVLMFFSFTIAVLMSLGVELPSPVEPIRNIIDLIVGK